MQMRRNGAKESSGSGDSSPANLSRTQSLRQLPVCISVVLNLDSFVFFSQQPQQ
jgi:hypothetical protein